MSLMEDAEKAVDKQFKAVVERIRFNMRNECPKDTGALRRSIYVKWNGKRDATITSDLTAGNGHQVLDYVENGNGNGMIRPKRAKSLAVGKRSGRDIKFRRAVHTYSGSHYVHRIAERYRSKYG